MADLFSKPVYEDDDTLAVTPEDRADPALAGLTDDEIRNAKTPVPGLFDKPVYEDADEPPPAPPEKGFIRGSIIDQLIGGYHDLRAAGQTYDAIQDTRNAQRVAAGKPSELASGGGGMFGALAQEAESTPEKRAETVARYKAQATEALTTAVEQAKKGGETPLSPETKAFLDENSGMTVWQALKAAPIKIITELGMRSMAASGIGIAAGAVGARIGGMPGAMVGMGAASARQDYVSSVVQGLQSRNVDVFNADALATAVADEKLMHEVEKEATLHAAVVGGVDGLTMLVGAKVLTPGIKNALVREVANVAAQAPVQAALGAAGEAGGELAAGQPLQPRQIAAEAAGEFASAPVDVLAGVAGGLREKEAAGPSPLNDSANAQPVVSAIEEAQSKARADIAARGGDKLDQEVGAALAAAEVSSHKRGAHDMTAPRVREAARQLQVEQDYLEGTAQSEEDNARAQIQNEAAARYEQGIPAPAPAPLEPVRVGKMVDPNSSVLQKPADATAQVAAQDKNAAKSADYDKALVQRDAQRVTQDQETAAVQAAAGEPARSTIGELVGKPKTLAERRAQMNDESVVKRKDSSRPNEPPGPPPGGQKELDPGKVRATSEQLALPSPKTARIEVNKEGIARPVSEAEVEQRAVEAKGPPMRQGLTTTTKEIPAAPTREVAPNTLAQRRAELAAQKQQINDAAAEAASSPKNDLAEPTQAQKDAGNYKMGHVKVHGLDISIETPKGGLRTFKKPGGLTASRRMRDHYGYVRRTEGADGDHVDVFVGDQPDSNKVFVIDQVKPDGSFDEHKAMLGYPDEAAAVAAYKRNYQPDWKVGPVTEMPVATFKKWAQEGDTKSPLKPDAIRVRNTLQARRAKDDGRLAEGDISVKSEKSKSGEQIAAFSEHGGDPEKGGSTWAQVNRERGTLNIFNSRVPQHLQGQQRGVRMMESMAARAEKEGLKLVSDTRVSEQAQHLYAALERRGYTVKRNPATRQASGELVSNSELKPVFEVSRPGRLADRRTQNTTTPEKSNEGRASMPRDAISEAEQAAPKISHADAKEALAPLLDDIGRDTNIVHARPQDMPQNIYESAVQRFGERRVNNARGYYHPLTDTTHIFANNHVSKDRVIQTALHEIVGHKGVRALLGKDYAATMLDVFKGAKDRTWMNDYASQHGLDPKDQGHQIILADEYIASIAEHNNDRPMLEKLLTAVRDILRKLGVVNKWTEADIRRLLHLSRSGLREASMHGRDAGPYGERLADGDIRPPKHDPQNPQSRIFKMNVTSQEQANYNPGFVRSRLDAIKDGGINAIPKALALIPRRNLPDFMGPGKMPSTKAYIRAAQRLDGRRSELLQVADETAKKWMKFTSKNKEEGRILGELMHAATLATVDPANAYKPLYAGERRGKPIPLTPEQLAIEAQRRGQYNALRKHWNTLSGEAKSIYIEVRDSYARQRDLVQQGLESRINSAEADGKVKQALIASLREKFEAGRVAGPYFPLARFGSHWASAKDKNGNVIAFSRFEKASEQRAWKLEMSRAGYSVDGGVKPNDASIAKQIDPAFVAKIASMLDEIDPAMADDVWQQYLRALPEMSMRKHFIHRKGRLGFTADALRAFAFQQFHGAHQIAKLEHMAVMDSLVEQIALEADKLANGPDEKWAAGLRDEFGLRHKWAKAPQSSLWATRLTGLGFAFYLGMTPAAALVNLTQTAIVGMPTLAARFNWLGAGTELMKAGALYAGSRGPLVNRLRGDEQKAFVEAKRVGLFEQTQAHDLAGLGEQGSLDYGSTRQKISAAISWMFHKTEEANRQITFLAAYRLSRTKGRSHEEAILESEDLTWDSHFDYANVNRPRLLQNDAAKVLLLFRQYSLNMTYRLARDFNDSIRGATPVQKKEARTRFAGIIGQTFLFAGVSGLPLYWLAKTVLDSAFGDDDDPFDTDAALRAWLYEQGGENFSQSVMDGTVGTAAHVDLSSRVGLNNLWLREPMENEDKGAFYLKEVAGPIGGMAVKAFQAADLSDDLYTERAIETATPKAVSDTVKAVRYAREGVANKRGDVLLPPEELNKYELFMQSIGFTPSDVALQYDQNRAVKGAEQRIEKRRVHLMNQIALATQNDDNTGWDEAYADINAFNEKNPGRAIDVKSLILSAKSRMRYSAEAVNGVRVEPGLRYLHEKLRFTDPEGENDQTTP